MDSTVEKTIEITVRGFVQGVGFRYSCRKVARELGVRGWANNQSDGSVLVIATATDEVLDQLLAWLKQGPPGARVDSVETQEIPSMETTSGYFEIR